MNIQFKTLFPKDGNANIDQLEIDLKFKLPTEYRDFVLEFNGGKPIPNKFKISESQEESRVSFFYGISTDKDFNILRNFALFENVYMEKYLPIGEDPGGDLICLDVSGENEGKIYFWDHEVAPPNNLYLVANSFTEFLEKLH